MRKVGHDRYRCARCGALLEISDAAKVRTMIVNKRGEHDVRIMYVAGTEIHRCEIADQRRT
jgi:hypothetical protein